MKCIILCSGYATRLYPLTLNTPKPLLPVKEKPLLNYLIENVSNVDEIDEIFIVSNDKFYNHFVDWEKSYDFEKKIKIINDNTKTNETRLGGIGDLWFTIEQEGIKDDFLLLLGDNYFSFDLNKIVDFSKKFGNVIGLQNINNLEEARKFGVLELGKSNKIISFEEKPENPKSSLISTGVYVYSKESINKIKEYVESDKPKDGPGYLIPYFLEFQDIYGYVLDGFWYDIGSKESYEEVK